MPIIKLIQSNFDKLKKNETYSLIIRTHGFIVKKFSDIEKLETELLFKIDPDDIIDVEIITEEEEHYLKIKFNSNLNNEKYFLIKSIEIPETMLYDKIKKFLDPNHQENSLSLINEELEINPENSTQGFQNALDNYLKKSQNLLLSPIKKSLEIIQNGFLAFKKNLTIFQTANIKLKAIENHFLLETKELELNELPLKVNNLTINHIDTAINWNQEIDLDNINKILIDNKDIYEEYYNDEEKNKPILLFIHPFGFDWTVWVDFIQEFYTQYRIIAFDQRGHGSSETHKKDYKFKHFFNDLISFMDLKGIIKNNDLYIITHSFTGLMFLHELKENQITNLKGLVFLSTGIRITDSFQSLINKIPHPNTWGPLKKVGKKKAMEIIFNQNTTKEKKEQIISIIYKTNHRVVYETVKNLLDKKFVSELSEKQTRLFSMPILSVFGGRDIIFPIETFGKFKKFINVSSHIIEDANHLYPFENPKVIVELIQNWLKEIS